jgi:hypothetical protein
MSIELLIGIVSAIVAIIVGGFAIIGTVVGGFVWISGKLEGIRKEIAKLDKDSVSHDICKQRRRECPCIKDIEELQNKQ